MGQFFEDKNLETKMVNNEEFPFNLTVHIYRRPNMRDDMLEMEMYLGRAVLDNLFDKMQVDELTTKVVFSFPERWLNIVEERSLFSRIAKYYPNMKDVQIKTQSVYIIQMTPAGCAQIVLGADEQAGATLMQESDSGHLWFPIVDNLISPTGITVL